MEAYLGISVATESDIKAIAELESKYIPKEIAYDIDTIRKWYQVDSQMFWVYEDANVI